MELRGVGDRWLAGEAVAGVAFALHDRVTVVDGEHAGAFGAVELLTALRPEPTYRVALGDGRRAARVPQSALRPAS